MTLKRILLLIFILIIVNNENVHGQKSPVITYSTPQVYTVGSVITPLSPTNTGGTVYPANYGVPANLVSYTTPFSIAIDGANNIYTTNNSTGDLTKFNAAGTPLFTVNTGNTQASEVAADGIGNVYVSQFTTSSVLKYNAAGTLLATITGFTDPYGIAFDASNNAYIADYFTGDIFKIVAGATTASVYLTGFTKPYGITIDETGNIYVGEQGPGDIIKVAAGTLTRTTFASGFNGPRHLNKDLFGNIYVADYGNNAIKRISPAGVITSVLSAGLSSPRQAAFDSSGNLFVANYGANALLKSLATSYSINAPLPSGLNFDTSTGQVTGTPATAIAATTFTITAYNTGGNSRVPLTIIVASSIKGSKLPVTVTTLPPSSITQTTATINGFAKSNGAPSLISFTYGKDAGLMDGATTVASLNDSLSAGGSNNSSLVLAGLKPATPYYYRIIANDSAGTSNGSIVSFKTLPSVNTKLAALMTSNGTLMPVFNPADLNYNVSVDNSISNITVTPVTSDPTATVTVNDTAVTSGLASSSQPLNIGNNTIAIAVTAQDGTTTQSYTIIINRAKPVIPVNSNANLSNLALSGVSLTPAFTSGSVSYIAFVTNNISSINVTPTTSDPAATVTVNGTAVASGTASVSQLLGIGDNTIITTVTAQDKTTTQSYAVTVIRAGSTNAALGGLTISNGSLSPVFTSGTMNYMANVTNNISSITITPVTSYAMATVDVNDSIAAYHTVSVNQPLGVGDNSVIIAVTAQNGTTTQSYRVTITRAGPLTSALAGLTLSNGSLSPAFATGMVSYTASVANNVSSLTVTPTTSDPTTSVMVNGVTVASGSASIGQPLKVGANTITTTVTSQDGTTKESYTVTVTRVASSNAALASLATYNGSLSPVFSSGTRNYIISVPINTINITVKPTTSDATATLTVNGIALSSGAVSAPIGLQVGSNTITTTVTAQDGITTDVYTITVIRAPSSNAGLSYLIPGSGRLNPIFTTGTTMYTDSVSNAIASVTVRPITSDPNATLTINGVALSSGSASAPIALQVGSNTITTTVTAQDGITTDVYTITVIRAPSSNAHLSNLIVSSGSLSPAFASGTTGYTASVSNSIASVTLNPTTSDPNATLTINGIALTSGAASLPIALKAGNNTITTVVTAQDGITTDIYTITITRSLSSNATLSNLAISGGTLSPAFATRTTSYTETVSNATSSVNITPVTSDATATLTVNGIALSSGAVSAPIGLQVGSNTITTTVTAQDGITTDVYTITVIRAPSSNAGLSYLIPGSGRLNPIFTTGTTMYTDSVSNAIASVTVRPITSDPNATLTINGVALSSGSASAPIALQVGSNTITTTVTAQDGITTDVYTITVIRAPSSNAHLSNLIVSSGSLSPAFASGTTGYTASVSNSIASVTLQPVTSEPNAILTINGTALSSGTTSAPIVLQTGSNTIKTVVTAQDGITKDIYTITVTRAPSSNAALLNPSISNGTLSHALAIGTISSKSNISSDTASIAIRPLAKDTNEDKIIVHQAVSPNGDGINDFLLIEGIENYPDNKVIIINRNGVIVYSVNGYNNSSKVFDGHSNISTLLQPSGTYFYMIEYTINEKVLRKTGYFILKYS